MSIIELNSENLNSYTLKDGIVVIDFWAAWCMPCKVIAPSIQKLNESYPNIIVGKYQIDSVDDLPIDLNIKSIPTIAVFKNGIEVDRLCGPVKYEAIEKLIQKHQ